MVVGLDGTRRGWVGIALGDDGRFDRDYVINEAKTDFAAVGKADIIAIDVPIGFGERKADPEAREYVGGRRAASVFTVPAKHVVIAASKEKKYRAGLGVSGPLHGIASRIVDVTELAASGRPIAKKLREVHPEVSFQAMNNDVPLRYAKKSYGGVQERIQLLGKHQIDLGGLSDDARALPIDDVLDAAASAWSAWRVNRGDSQSFPCPPERQGQLRVAIWY